MERKYESLAKYIKYYRRLRDLTQEELAKKAEITRTYMSMIESGFKRAAPEVMQKIANTLGLEESEWHKVYFSDVKIALSYSVNTSSTQSNKEDKPHISPEDRLLYAYFDIIKDRYKKCDEKARASIRQGLESLIQKEEREK